MGADLHAPATDRQAHQGLRLVRASHLDPGRRQGRDVEPGAAPLLDAQALRLEPQPLAIAGMAGVADERHGQRGHLQRGERGHHRIAQSPAGRAHRERERRREAQAAEHLARRQRAVAAQAPLPRPWSNGGHLLVRWHAASGTQPHRARRGSHEPRSTRQSTGSRDDGASSCARIAWLGEIGSLAGKVSASASSSDCW